MAVQLGLPHAGPRRARHIPHIPHARDHPFLVRGVSAMTAAVIAGGAGYLGAGYLAWREHSLARIPSDPRIFAAQTPADFVAASGDGTLVVDTSAYRFTDYRTVDFPARGDAITIAGWYAPGAAGVASPLVIVVHGVRASKADPNVLFPAAMLHRAGFGVLLIDLRNHGDSDVDNGRFTGGSKEYADVLGAFDWLLAQGHLPERIGLFGASLGGATCMIALGQEPRIAALWEDSGPGDVTASLREYAEKLGFPGWIGDAAVPVARALGEPTFGRKSPLEEIRLRLGGRPFAIVHGLDDTTVKPHHALDLAIAAEAGGTAVTPWLVPNARHTEEVLVVTAEYEARLTAFFRSALGAPGVPGGREAGSR